MKSFQFRLEPVLSMRRAREDELQCKLAESQRILDVELARLEALRRQVKALGRQSSGTGGLDLSALEVRSGYLSALELRIKAQLAHVEDCSGRVQEDRAAVILASQERKTLEKLKEKLQVGFVKSALSKEQQTTEEMASLRYLMNRRLRLADSVQEA